VFIKNFAGLADSHNRKSGHFNFFQKKLGYFNLKEISENTRTLFKIR
jgi:hypothetical protein